MNKINIGCGLNIKESNVGVNWVNLDMTKHEGVDVVWDLNKFPYPFKDEEFDEVYCSHILEHLDDFSSVMEELSRILKNGKMIIISVPHPCWSMEAHPYHKTRFNINCFGYLVPSNQIEQKPLFSKVIELKILFFKSLHIWNYLIEPLVNISRGTQDFYGNTGLCYIFPPKDIYVVIEK